MKSLTKGICMGLLLLSTVAYAGSGKAKPAAKKPQTTQTCCPKCPPSCPPATCPKGGSCCHK